MATDGDVERLSAAELEKARNEIVRLALSTPGIEAAMQHNGVREVDVASHLHARLRQVDSLAEGVLGVAAANRVDRDADERQHAQRVALLSREASQPLVAAMLGGGGLLLAAALAIGVIDSAAMAVSIFGALVGSTGIALMFQLPRLRRMRREALAAAEGSRSATADIREWVMENLILPEVRQRINELAAPPFTEIWAPLDSTGLKKLFDPEYEVSLGATELLQSTLQALEAGSVGIAGPRGVGKTTILRAACDGRLGESQGFDGRGVLVSAPVRYAGPDFIRFIFARLCMKVLEHGGLEERVAAQVNTRRAYYRNLLVAGAVSLFATGTFLLAVGVAVEDLEWFPVTLLLFGVSGLLGLSALLLYLWFGVAASKKGPLESLAQRNLERLQFLETVSEERTSELAARGAKLASRRGVSRASLAWTLPEVIDNYRELAGMVAEQRPLLIGIDELDKMATPEDARGFLNEMKSLFDQPGVFYLVSISEDALSDFERRGQPIRDVFDSVFSDVLHLDYLTLDESRLLLERRVIGIPPPWPALFHSLAGGLPRELLRVARSASRLAIEDQDRLESVAKKLVAARVRAHEHATAVMGERDLAPDGSQPVLSWLRNLPPIETTQDLDATLSALRQRLDLKRLFEELREGSMPEEARQRLERLMVELAASCYHSLTCLEFFARLTDARYQEALAIRGGRCSLEQLSQAHQDLSVAPRLAWETLDSFRTHEGLDLLAYPS